MKRPCRLILPCAIAVRTASTFEPSSFSTARLMSTLVAPAPPRTPASAVLAQERRLLGDQRAADDVS